MDDVLARIEHTALGPTTTWADVTEVLDGALRYGMRACIPACYLERAGEYAPGVECSTVVAFPHGQAATEAKAAVAREAYNAGAAEIDVVANAGYLLGGDRDAYLADIEEVVAAVPAPVKVIVEAPRLDEVQLRAACEAAVDADAAYLKTATGFGPGGATVADVEVMSQYLPVKASGGIGSWAEAEAMFEAGAERVGASAGEDIAAEYRDAVGDSAETEADS